MTDKEKKPRLLKWQYDELNAQYGRTPEPSEGWSASGEHYLLFDLLNKFGFKPNSREEAMRMTGELLAEGWRDE